MSEYVIAILERAVPAQAEADFSPRRLTKEVVDYFRQAREETMQGRKFTVGSADLVRKEIQPIAPSLLAYELASALDKRVRRGELSLELAQARLTSSVGRRHTTRTLSRLPSASNVSFGPRTRDSGIPAARLSRGSAGSGRCVPPTDSLR